MFNAHSHDLHISVYTNDMLEMVQKQLAVDLNCNPEDLDKGRNSFVFCEAMGDGRPPDGHFQMVSMGGAVVVSATPDVLPYVKAQMSGKSRDEAFAQPFVTGHAICYLPDIANLRPLGLPDGFACEMLKRAELPKIYSTPGFKMRPGTSTAFIATHNGTVAGIAGASGDYADMRLIEVCILPEYRGSGVAAYLLNTIAIELLNAGYVPYCRVPSSAVESQRVSRRAGFSPSWVCAQCVAPGKF